MQILEAKDKFSGDRYGEFIGDDVAILSDGSIWKIHPESRDIFSEWQGGEVVDVGVRTDWYWFKREHKFTLYNHDRKEVVKAMIIRHKQEPLKIVGTDLYYKSKQPVFAMQEVFYVNEYGELKSRSELVITGFEPSDPRKVLMLSDGSTWVVKDKFTDFQLGMNVYVGAQGSASRDYYDFILITGTEREAQWTWARPQK